MVMTRRLSASTPSACQRRGWGCVAGFMWVSFGRIGSSRDRDLAHASDRRALRDEERQEPQRVLFACGLDPPPDRVAAGRAGGQRRAVAERALVALEGGERDAALVRLVAGVADGRRRASRPDA